MGAALRSGAILREAHRGDIPAIQRVRHSVRENVLTSGRITDAEVQITLESTGRGWVIEADHAVVAFAIGRATDGNLWALFVEPSHERQGYGRRLHDATVGWLWAQGLAKLWLTTAAGTRAQHFYEAAGWQRAGTTQHGEIPFELARAAADVP
jgi:GNAT superfamily N-acetyltransferase